MHVETPLELSSRWSALDVDVADVNVARDVPLGGVLPREAPQAAKDAANSCPQGAAPIPLGLVKAVLRGELREKLRGRIADKAPDHLWLRATDGGMPRHAGLTRGNQRAKQLVEQLEKELNPQQIAEADAFVKAFKPVPENPGGAPGANAPKTRAAAIRAGLPNYPVLTPNTDPKKI